MKLLRFCNMLDSRNNLSLTNLALVCLVGKMLIAADISSCVAVVLAFGNYMHKRSTSVSPG